MKSTFAEKIMHRLAFICGAVIIMIVMAGCSAGSTIDTTLVINKDLSGVRQMNITISESVYQEYFTGSIEDLNALMDEACPEGMTWSYSDADGVKQYNMEIAFASPEDYKAKIESILGVESAELTIAAPDTVWASGISVEEGFTDKQLLKWMEDLMVNNGFVSSGNADMIFSTGAVNVVYGDEIYSASSRINVSRIEYVSVDAIHILTQINEPGSYGRRVIVQIPADSMAKKGDEIRAYMDGVVPDGAAGEWSDEEGFTLFTVEADNLTVEQLENFDRAVFDSESCSAAAEDVSQYFSPFTFDEHLTEHIDLTGYLAGDYSSIRVTYAIKNGDSYDVYDSADGISKGYQGQPWEEYSGYNLYCDEYCYGSSMDFSTLIQKVYKVKKLTVETDRTFGGDWERTLSFTLENVPTEEEQAGMIGTLEARMGVEAADEMQESESDQEQTQETGTDTNGESVAGQSEDDRPDVKISGSLSDGVYTIVITQKGSGEEIENGSELLLGTDTSVFYACDREFWKVKKQEAFEEAISFGNLLENVTDDFELDYTAKLGLFSNMQYCSDDSAELKGGKLHVISSDKRVDIIYVGSRIDVLAVLFWVFLAVGVVSLLILVIKLSVLKKKARLEETAVEEQNEAKKEAPAQEKPDKERAEPAVSGFCEKCGAPREADAKFCEKCGSKFEN